MEWLLNLNSNKCDTFHFILMDLPLFLKCDCLQIWIKAAFEITLQFIQFYIVASHLLLGWFFFISNAFPIILPFKQ